MVVCYFRARRCISVVLKQSRLSMLVTEGSRFLADVHRETSALIFAIIANSLLMNRQNLLFQTLTDVISISKVGSGHSLTWLLFSIINVEIRDIVTNCHDALILKQNQLILHGRIVDE